MSESFTPLYRGPEVIKARYLHALWRKKKSCAPEQHFDAKCVPGPIVDCTGNGWIWGKERIDGVPIWQKEGGMLVCLVSGWLKRLRDCLVDGLIWLIDWLLSNRLSDLIGCVWFDQLIDSSGVGEGLLVLFDQHAAYERVRLKVLRGCSVDCLIWLTDWRFRCWRRHAGAVWPTRCSWEGQAGTANFRYVMLDTLPLCNLGISLSLYGLILA